MIRRLVLTLTLLAGVLAWHPASAEAPARPQPLVRMSVVDRDTGAELSQYHGRGERWIAGAPGHRYAVRLANLGGERVLVVLSVDGVNAVSGETAAPSQAGYVLDPWETADITGWRKSLDDVAAFVFTDLGDSYAARTGRPDNVGVIGMAVFRERVHAWQREAPLAVPRPEARETGKSATAAAAPPPMARPQAADAATQAIGTGHGDRERAPVSTTGFVRATRMPGQQFELRYDAEGRLVALGILPRRWAAPGPLAFPGSFVPDPPAG